MRRARIKAVATVPVRRKPTQDAPSTVTTNIVESEDKGGNEEPSSDQSVQIPPREPECLPKSNEFSNHMVSPKTNSGDEQQHDRLHSYFKHERIDATEESDATQSDSEEIENTSSRTEVKENQNPSSPQIENENKDTHTTEDEVQEAPSQVNGVSDNSSTNDPVSPTKTVQNRSCFMRPIPRFDGGGRMRRNSIHGSGASASESEDDGKKPTYMGTNRVRNDSVCSVQSVKETTRDSVAGTKNDPTSATKAKGSTKRRVMISESARKLAEARREFFLKYENKAPDRSKLTMYDLIYYNPSTNPMKKSREGGMGIQQVPVCETVDTSEKDEEEQEDDPTAMPVPQVKVGPDGELIIDEQSLVIEQSDAKKRREILAKKAIIDDDNNGSGFYKRRQKSKDWSKWETLKFYKALNTVGTDFLLMQSLFPNRTRQEIKMKYKKEERINRSLIEKALIYHQEFDTETLEKDLAAFEREMDIPIQKTQKRKYSDGKPKDKTKAASKGKRTCRFVTSSIAQEDATDGEEEDEVLEMNVLSKQISDSETNNNTEQDMGEQNVDNMKQKSIKCNNKRKLKKVLKENSVEDEMEIYKIRPTRSGRLPKVKKLQGPDVNTLDENRGKCLSKPKVVDPQIKLDNNKKEFANTPNKESNNTPEVIRTAIPDISQVEPGSLVILSTESSDEPGKTILQVYMVTSITNSGDRLEQNITPIDLSPELLATVTDRLSDVQPISVKEEHQ